MNTRQEYEKFMEKFIHAVKDVADEYHRLSPETKCLVEKDAYSILQANGLVSFLEMIKK